MNFRALVCAAALSVVACGSSESPTVTSLQTHNFSATLVDPTRCQCGNGITQHAIDVTASGRLDAAVSWSPADATVVLRLLAADLNTVLTTSAPRGTTASINHNVTPGRYVLQLFLVQSGGTTATYQLLVTHP